MDAEKKQPSRPKALVDDLTHALYLNCMQTVVDVDEKLLNLAEQKAHRDGKSLAALVEDALRVALLVPPPLKAVAEEVETVDGDEACFIALDEIRTLGRVPAPHRQVELP